MFTDRIPKKATSKDEYMRSDLDTALSLPADAAIQTLAQDLMEALAREDKQKLQTVSNELAQIVSDTYGVKAPKVKVLGVRPREVTEDSVEELFGDYDPNTFVIRLWMRTAVLKKPTAFGTFLHTLCHEICHHIDVVALGYKHTYHTRGFFERNAKLYHHIRQTPIKKLVWIKQNSGTYRIDWQATMRSRPSKQ